MVVACPQWGHQLPRRSLARATAIPRVWTARTRTQAKGAAETGHEPEVARSAKLTARGGVPPVKSPSTTYIRLARPLFLSGIADTGNNFGAQNFRVSMGDA
jgi:hypothetical protein